MVIRDIGFMEAIADLVQHQGDFMRVALALVRLGVVLIHPLAYTYHKGYQGYQALSGSIIACIYNLTI